MLHHLEFPGIIAFCVWVSISKCIGSVVNGLVLLEGRGKCNGRWFFTASHGTERDRLLGKSSSSLCHWDSEFTHTNVIIAFRAFRTGSG